MQTTTSTKTTGQRSQARSPENADQRSADVRASRGADGGWLSEADAIQVALTGSSFDRLKIGARALYELVRNPDDTAQVFLMGITLNATSVPRLFLRFATAPGGKPLLDAEPAIDSHTVDFDRLRALPAATLGGAYARYLDDNHLDPDLFQAPPGLPPMLSFMAQRIRQTHDIWHVLTGYAPDVPGELALQGFTFAQMRMPSSFLIATVGTAFRAPREARNVWEGYERGLKASFLPVVRFEEHWDEELTVLRSRLNIVPMRSRS